MHYEEMKLECLRLAIEAGLKGDDAIAMANKFYDMVRGRGEFSEMTYERVPNKPPKANVVGKDSDFVKPFKDYLTKDEG